MKMMKEKSKWEIGKRIAAYLLVLAMIGSVMPEMPVRAEGAGELSEKIMANISAEDITKTYDGNAYGIEVTGAPVGATITYGTEEGICNLEKSPAYKDVGEYVVYYKIGADGYKDYEGSAKITIACGGHKWNGGAITKSPTDTSAGVYTYTCTNGGCTGKKEVALPQKTITVTLGKSYIIPKDSVCSMALQSASKHKKYLTFNSKTGKITTKNNSKYYKSLKTATIKVTVGKTSYNMKVKCTILKSSVEKKLSIKRTSVGKNYKYKFSYNFANATKVKVRVVEAKSNKKLNKILDKYLSKPKSKSSSYFTTSKKNVKKQGRRGKLTFQTTVYYGKNSVTFTKTK